MLTKLEEKIISKYVDEFIDNLRTDVTIFDSKRAITQPSESRIIIINKDFLIDNSREYRVLLRNPLEGYFFIPNEIDYYETQIELDFDRVEEFRITNFVDACVTESESISIDHPMVTDSCLRNLISLMCFDLDYQKQEPKVKTVIEDFLSTLTNSDSEKLKNRITPFLVHK